MEATQSVGYPQESGSNNVGQVLNATKESKLAGALQSLNISSEELKRAIHDLFLRLRPIMEQTDESVDKKPGLPVQHANTISGELRDVGEKPSNMTVFIRKNMNKLEI